MIASISFLLSIIARIADFIRTNVVLCFGFVLIAVNIICYVIDKTKKLLH